MKKNKSMLSKQILKGTHYESNKNPKSGEIGIQLPQATPMDSDYFINYGNGVCGKSQFLQSPGLPGLGGAN